MLRSDSVEFPDIPQGKFYTKTEKLKEYTPPDEVSEDTETRYALIVPMEGADARLLTYEEQIKDDVGYTTMNLHRRVDAEQPEFIEEPEIPNNQFNDYQYAISDAIVTIFNEDGNEVEGTEDEFVTTLELPIGTYTFETLASGCDTVRGSFTIDHLCNPTNNLNVEVPKKYDTSLVSFELLNRTELISSDVADQAEISVYNNSGVEIYPIEGTKSWNLVRDDIYSVDIDLDGFEHKIRDITVDDIDEETFPMELTESDCKVVFVIENKEFKELSVYDFVVYTDEIVPEIKNPTSDNKFIYNLARGEYIFELQVQGFKPIKDSFIVDNDELTIAVELQEQKNNRPAYYKPLDFYTVNLKLVDSFGSEGIHIHDDFMENYIYSGEKEPYGYDHTYMSFEDALFRKRYHEYEPRDYKFRIQGLNSYRLTSSITHIEDSTDNDIP